MSVQELYRESNIIDCKFDESSKTMSSIEEILTESFAKKIETKAVKYISPSIWPLSWKKVGEENGIDLIDVYIFRFLHRAYVDNPAFGEKARIYATCHGHGSECKMQFNAAANDDNLSHLQEIPIITRHMGNLFFTHDRPKCTPCQNNRLNYKIGKIKQQIQSS